MTCHLTWTWTTLRRQYQRSFFRREVVVGAKKHLIFCTATQINSLVKGKTWYIDGTFKVVKHHFYQLLSIHFFIKSDPRNAGPVGAVRGLRDRGLMSEVGDGAS